MTHGIANIALSIRRLLCVAAVLAPFLVANSAGAVKQKCLICCQFCGSNVCAATCRGAQDGDVDCDSARAALRSALSSGRIGLYRNGKPVDPGEAASRIDGMSCDEAIAKAEELTSFKRRPPRSQNATGEVANGLPRRQGNAGAAPAPAKLDPFKHVADQVNGAPAIARPSRMDSQFVGGLPTEPRQGQPNAPQPAAKQLEDAINAGDWDAVDKLVKGSFQQLKEGQLSKDLEIGIQQLKDRVNSKEEADAAVTKALVLAVARSLSTYGQESSGKSPPEDLPPAVRVSEKALEGDGGPLTSHSYVSRVVEAATKRDPRPFMSPNWVDAGGVGLDITKAFGTGALKPLKVASPLVPTLEVSPETGRAELVYDKLVERGMQAFVQGGAIVSEQASGTVTKLANSAAKWVGVAEAIQIADRLAAPVSKRRLDTFNGLVNEMLESFRSEYLDREVEFRSVQSALGDPNNSPELDRVIRERLWELHEEKRAIVRAQAAVQSAQPTATTQSWYQLFGDATPFFGR